MAFSQVQEQPGAISVLTHALRSGQLAQAYLFVGPSGVGKQRTALALALAGTCPEGPLEGCGHCESCTRVLSGNHPDVRIFGPRDEGSRNLQVDFVRNEVLPVTKFAPFEAERAFLIFPQADVSFPLQHAEAANALLKTIEEPKAGLHFVLLSERPDRLLPTIRSRCQRVRFGRLPTPRVLQILRDHGVAEDAAGAAAAMAGGRADRALELAQEGRADAILDWALRVDAETREASPGNLVTLAEELSRSDDRILVLDTLALFYRDVAAASLGLTEALAFGHRADFIASRASELGARRAAQRVGLIERTSEDLERNANPELSLDALMFGLSAPEPPVRAPRPGRPG